MGNATHVRKFFKAVLAPTFPGKIFCFANTIASVLLAIGLGAWSIIGAWRMLIYLVHVYK
jgi:hypothetical protein